MLPDCATARRICRSLSLIRRPIRSFQRIASLLSNIANQMQRNSTSRLHGKQAHCDHQNTHVLSAATEVSMSAKRPLRLAGVVFASLALGWSVSGVAEQRYPNRPIKLVVPYDAGGPGDIIARTLADKLSISLKQPLVIENRPGAGGNIGTDVVAKAAPDGYTLGLVVSTTLTVNPALYKKLPFDPEKDIRPISIVTTTGLMLAVHASVPVNSVAEFVAYAKVNAAKKEPIAYASSGNGTPSHLAMERFRLHAGFRGIPCSISKRRTDDRRSRSR